MCGNPFKPTSNRQKYCKTHQKEVKKEQTRKRVQRFREEWPKGCRKGDKGLKGTGSLGSKPQPNLEDEKQTIKNELKRLGLA